MLVRMSPFAGKLSNFRTIHLNFVISIPEITHQYLTWNHHKKKHPTPMIFSQSLTCYPRGGPTDPPLHLCPRQRPTTCQELGNEFRGRGPSKACLLLWGPSAHNSLDPLLLHHTEEKWVQPMYPLLMGLKGPLRPVRGQITTSQPPIWLFEFMSGRIWSTHQTIKCKPHV